MKSGVVKTFFLIALPAALFVVALVFAGMEFRRFLLNSPKFTIQSVELVTEGAASKVAILKRLSFLNGANIFQVDLADIQKKVEEDPWVYAATVVRALPNKIQIHYTPQTPRAILGADSMYYLNSEGKPFYRIQLGDSLLYPLIQVEGKSEVSESLRKRVEVSLQIIEELKISKAFSEKDLGDITVRAEDEESEVPISMSLRYPPKNLLTKKENSAHVYTVSFGKDNISSQVKRWESVVRYLVQQNRAPKLIRLELGKKVVVKLDQ
jgi:cell division septal protein FtsQ